MMEDFVLHVRAYPWKSKEGRCQCKRCQHQFDYVPQQRRSGDEVPIALRELRYESRYRLVPSPLAWMDRAHHHCRGGRSRSERFLDRRGWDNNPDLRSENSQVRFEAWETKLEDKRKPCIYPARVTDEDMRRREQEDNRCLECDASLAGYRRDAMFCCQVCKKRYWRGVVPAKASRSQYMGRVKMRKRPLTNWCPVCKAYRQENHPQPCQGGK